MVFWDFIVQNSVFNFLCISGKVHARGHYEDQPGVPLERTVRDKDGREWKQKSQTKAILDGMGTLQLILLVDYFVCCLQRVVCILSY